MLRVLTVAGALLVIAQLHRASGGVVALELNRAFGLGAGRDRLRDRRDDARLGGRAAAGRPRLRSLRHPADGLGDGRCSALLGTLLFAAADGFVGLALARFLIGAGFAGAVTSIMLLAMHWAPPERFATVAATVLALSSLVGGLLATTPLALALQRVRLGADLSARRRRSARSRSLLPTP